MLSRLWIQDIFMAFRLTSEGRWTTILHSWQFFLADEKKKLWGFRKWEKSNQPKKVAGCLSTSSVAWELTWQLIGMSEEHFVFSACSPFPFIIKKPSNLTTAFLVCLFVPGVALKKERWCVHYRYCCKLFDHILSETVTTIFVLCVPPHILSFSLINH